MNRRRFLETSAGLALATNAFSGCESPQRSRPNPVWLDAEDLSPDLGCYGHPLVQTPNLDGLAAEGTRFEKAFVTCPVCSPSRSAIITGMYQTSTGCHNHRSHRDDGYELPEGVRLVTDYFRDSGYFVSRGQANDLSKPGKLDYNFKKDFHEAYDGTDWRQRDPDQPFFSHVHFSETHRTFYRDPERPIDPARVDLPPYYPDHPVTRNDWAAFLD